MTDIPIFCVAMEREDERRARISTHLSNLNLDFEFFSAVDGKSLSEDLLQLYSPERSIEALSRELKKGELGCYFSHVNVWRKIVDKQLPYALVIESDVILRQSIKDVLESFDLLPDGWDLIKLYYGDSVISYHRRTKLAGGLICAPLANKSAGTVAYMISLEGARKFLEKIYPVYLPIDVWMTGGRVEKGSNQYAVWPPCATTNDQGYSFVTESDQAGDLRQRSNKTSFLKKVERKMRWFRLKLQFPRNEF